MNRPRTEKNPRTLNIYESLANAVFGQHARQAMDDGQLNFLWSFLEGVYYNRIDEDFIGLVRECMEAGLFDNTGDEASELLVRTDFDDSGSVNAHMRIMRQWLQNRADSEH